MCQVLWGKEGKGGFDAEFRMAESRGRSERRIGHHLLQCPPSAACPVSGSLEKAQQQMKLTKQKGTAELLIRIHNVREHMKSFETHKSKLVLNFV